MIPKELKYTKDHEWAKLEDGKVRIGVTDYAQRELGDIVYVELPEVGQKVAQGDQIATLESVKAVGEVFAPVSGEVVEANTELESSPELVNKEPYGAGWIAVIKMDNPAELDKLLDAEAYGKLVEEGE